MSPMSMVVAYALTIAAAFVASKAIPEHRTFFLVVGALGIAVPLVVYLDALIHLVLNHHIFG